MNIINKKTLQFQKEFFVDEINDGKIFIYPTDTLYGLGCDATNDDAVKKIFNIKQRENKPLLIIVPNKQWIYTNCEISEIQKQEIETKLPGPYSFIVKLKKQTIENNLISQQLLCGKDTIGIRIPNSSFTNLIQYINKPFITTSVNISGEKSALKPQDINKEIFKQVDYVVKTDEELLGKPSSIFDLTTKIIKQLR